SYSWNNLPDPAVYLILQCLYNAKDSRDMAHLREVNVRLYKEVRWFMQLDGHRPEVKGIYFESRGEQGGLAVHIS
ncbi:hypothetical protein PMAYCL1PPCAC_06443, partial [Pristionchus mayeri]